jgi:hypothetical protein
LGCLCEPPLPYEEAAYLRYLSHLLDSPLQMLPRQPENGVEPGWQGTNDSAGLDLLLYQEPERPWWQRWLGWTPASRVIDHNHSSVLIVRRPRWPLRRILLILRGHETDEAAVQWLGRVARPARAEVIVLPIIPPFPVMFRHGSLPLQAEVLLSPNTFSGVQLRRLASLFTHWDIETQILLNDSEPQARIEWALQTSGCDLVILSDESYHWIHRQFLGELVRPLLRKGDRPILIAKDEISV